MATPSESNGAHASRRRMPISVTTIAGIAAALAIALSLLAQATHERIARNRQAWITQHMDALLPPGSYDNDLLNDTITVTDPAMLGTAQPVTIYRARRNGAPVAAVIRPIAPDGYRGPIELLVAIAHDGTLIGVQVIRHNETPGLGDAFQTRHTDWLPKFRGSSLRNPTPQRWTVQQEGGEFDAFTGATITPRAIVKAVRRALEYYAANRQNVFREVG